MDLQGRKREVGNPTSTTVGITYLFLPTVHTQIRTVSFTRLFLPVCSLIDSLLPLHSLYKGPYHVGFSRPFSNEVYDLVSSTQRAP